jgi:hypothetical protein
MVDIGVAVAMWGWFLRLIETAVRENPISRGGGLVGQPAVSVAG